MRKKQGGVVFAIIALILIAWGVTPFDAIWSFPGNLPFCQNFPTSTLPLGTIPLIVILLVGTGIFLSLKLGMPQIRYFWHGVKVTRGIYDDPNDQGDLTHFKALTTALSATVGIGNIAGVATAIYYGGPGALFWMWVTAFFGTTLKFAECTLALNFREIDKDGYTAGGPMYTIERGLGIKWRWLAVMFACFAIICSLATGNAIQSFTVSDQLYAEITTLLGSTHWLTVKHILFDGFAVSLQQILNGIVIAFLVGVVVLGGIRRIGNVTAILAPVMAIIYVIAALAVIIANYSRVGESFQMIFAWAFNPPAELAGVGSGTFMVIMNTMLWGVKRGLYSNEAGQGSAAIAHSTAKTQYPIREGAVALLEPFIDTIIICTLTGLVITTTGAWQHTQFYVSRIDPAFSGPLFNSSLLTSFAFKSGLSWLFAYGDKIVTLSVLLFAVSTAISWSFYGNRATEYLFGKGAVKYYLWVYVLFTFLGAIAGLEAVWAFGDAALGFMTIPNLLALLLLSGRLKQMATNYFSEQHMPFKSSAT